jgi:hypothetical protein
MHDVFAWAISIGTTFGAIGTVWALLYTANPEVFMMSLYLVVSFVMTYISASAAIGVLSWLFFGRFLVSMIASHDDVPAICAVSCK